jgi:protein-L-isoaspartate(D-aspartate) O-methyltransferase
MLYMKVGETGRTVGVEHIPELVKRSIDAIKQTPAGHLMDKGRIVVHGKQQTSHSSHHNT